MASKKLTLVMALLGLMQTAAFAQSSPGSASDSFVFDSTKVATSKLPQYNDFQKNAYPYPAKPKSQLELGGGVGSGFVLGDRPLFSHGYTGGLTGSLSIRKALSHTFSVRAGYSGSIITIPHEASPALNTTAAKNLVHSLNVDFVVSLNAASPYRGNPKTNVYVFTGYDLVATQTEVGRIVNGGIQYHPLYYPQTGDITTFGGTAHQTATNASTKDWHLIHAASLGAGIAFKLSDKFNLGLEERLIIPLTYNDFLDGNSIGRNAGDHWSYSTIRLNMNIGNSATHVPPLWWINPNNYVYSELTNPKHLKVTPTLPDADGDGVTDQFDLEPNTPAGAPVDSHGRAKDTDGDGVPDYKDKEILTPQSCFPVNSDGVGTCPEPACCKELRDRLKSDEDGDGFGHKKCNLSSLPSVAFKAGSYKLSKEAQTILTSASAQIQANPTCNVKVVGYVTDVSKKAQQLSWDRVNAVIKYLVEKTGVSEARIIFSYDTNGSSNSVDLIPTTETGPNTAPAPAPNFRSKK